ncbi:hypothetical protein [Acetobacterium sp. K1/6]|jgi:hypothetical protein|uniref:hypothetical protein n=2 Tax=unclassified Acetobacterium TaxID=2638182 RepID=UPI002ACAAA01|nr:hypothetical protein [Acetobacterium sp. K1/6]MDZ5726412.1 hypothetical protein [Acetobacterium sp. K1/6]
MGRINEETHRFIALPFVNETLKMEVWDKDRWLFYMDCDNQSVPYVVIEKEKTDERVIQTTRDLMDVEAHLFSNEKNALLFMNNFKGE